MKKSNGNELHSAYVSDVQINRAINQGNRSSVYSPGITSISSPDRILSQWLDEGKAAYDKVYHAASEVIKKSDYDLWRLPTISEGIGRIDKKFRLREAPTRMLAEAMTKALNNKP